ncbi:MAG: hypothetical protein J7L47_03870 [Candidatus Odinarchaeota archaeon]|nr:hypothetical protein [Candidatus Odinarchaeota archaeon]
MSTENEKSQYRFINIFQEIATRRLKKKEAHIKRKFPWVVALKLSGSISDGYYFLLQFKDVTIASDYDIIAIVDKFPEEQEIKAFIEYLKEYEFEHSEIERLLVEHMDVKIYAKLAYYPGEGVRLPTVFERDTTTLRHIQGGIIIFGEEVFSKYSKLTEREIRRVFLRVRDREKIFNLYTDLGGLLREANALGLKEIETKIIDILRKFKNYHILSNKDTEELEQIRNKLVNEMKKTKATL